MSDDLIDKTDWPPVHKMEVVGVVRARLGGKAMGDDLLEKASEIADDLWGYFSTAPVADEWIERIAATLAEERERCQKVICVNCDHNVESVYNEKISRWQHKGSSGELLHCYAWAIRSQKG